MWFVRAIIVLYLFFYFFRWVDVKMSKDDGLTLLLFIILLLLGVVATLGIRWSGIGDSISVPFFFLGVAIARWQNFSRRVFRSVPMLILILAILSAVAYWWRMDNRVLHGVINYFVMIMFVALLAFVDVRITQMPKWVGGCSYDLYLVHYKMHLLLVFLFGVDYLWMFIIGTALATIGFYRLRKMCKL